MTDRSSQNLRGAKKSTKKAGMLTVVQRYVSKYGIKEGVKRYKQDGWKQKKASKKVRAQVSTTKQGPRRVSEEQLVSVRSALVDVPNFTKMATV